MTHRTRVQQTYSVNTTCKMSEGWLDRAEPHLFYGTERSHDDNMITVSLMLHLWFNFYATTLENIIIIPKILYINNFFFFFGKMTLLRNIFKRFSLSWSWIIPASWTGNEDYLLFSHQLHRKQMIFDPFQELNAKNNK